MPGYKNKCLVLIGVIMAFSLLACQKGERGKYVIQAAAVKGKDLVNVLEMQLLAFKYTIPEPYRIEYSFDIYERDNLTPKQRVQGGTVPTEGLSEGRLLFSILPLDTISPELKNRVRVGFYNAVSGEKVGGTSYKHEIIDDPFAGMHLGYSAKEVPQRIEPGKEIVLLQMTGAYEGAVTSGQSLEDAVKEHDCVAQVIITFYEHKE